MDLVLTSTAFPATQGKVDQRIDGREWLGLQCAVLRGTDLILNLAAGEYAPGTAMTRDDRLRWTCSSKVAITVLFAALHGEGLVDIDRLVDDYLPGFPRPITCAHLLSHTAGLAEAAEVPFLIPFHRTVSLVREHGVEPGFQVGEQRRYSSFANFAVLAAVAEAATGRGIAELIDTWALAPACAVDTGFAIDPARPDPTWIGDAGTLTPAVGEVIPEAAVAGIWPGAGLIGPANDLARLLRLLSPHSADRPRAATRFVTRRAPFTPCLRSGDTAEWGLGVVVGWSRFGRCASGDSFGHSGSRSSLVMHDPAHDITIAVISNTLSKSLVRSERVKPFVSAIYTDLGL